MGFHIVMGIESDSKLIKLFSFDSGERMWIMAQFQLRRMPQTKATIDVDFRNFILRLPRTQSQLHTISLRKLF
jgi:hypothetical protein